MTVLCKDCKWITDKRDPPSWDAICTNPRIVDPVNGWVLRPRCRDARAPTGACADAKLFEQNESKLAP